MNRSQKYFIFLFYIFILNTSLLFTQNTDFNLYFNLSDNYDNKFVLIDKAENKLKIIQEAGLNKSRVIQTFPIKTTQANDKNNTSEDTKFPEGIYFPNKLLQAQQHSSDSTPVALLLDYPNPIDSVYTRGEFDLWIQELTTNVPPQNKNSIYIKGDLQKLVNNINITRTPILITSQSEYKVPITNTQYRNTREYWSDFVSKWKSSLKSGNFNNFLELFATLYKEKNQNLDSSFTLYRTDNTSFSSPIIYELDDQALLIFEYSNPSKSIDTNLLFYLINISNEWKIIHTTKKDLNEKAIIKKELRSFLQSWQIAWENKNLSKYISMYDSSFYSDGKDYSDWQQYKEEKFQQAENINIELSSIKINKIDQNLFSVEFKQDYSRRGYEDFGIKTLKIKTYDNSVFRITAESWRALRE